MTSVQRIQAIIESCELDVLVATATDGSKLDHVTGSVQDLKAAVALMDESFEGPFFLEGYKSTNANKVGRKADTDKPFRWKMAGVAKAMAQQPQTRVETVRTPDLESIRLAAERGADARIAEHGRTAAENEAAELRARVVELEMELGEVDDEEEEEEEDMGSAPWYADEEKTLRMMGAFRDLFASLGAKPAARVPQDAQVSNEERELLEAFRRFKESRPNDAENTKEQLLAAYGQKQPAANEQQ